MNDTIVAISTQLGNGAISIVRLSGTNAIEIVNKVFDKDLSKKESNTINYGNIVYKDEIIDEVLVSIMKKPNTFTGEDVVEINCHGGVAVTKKVLEIILKEGARLADPGEFTKRRFLNGKIDLIKAEAISELIKTKNEKARKIAIENLKGNTSNKIKDLRNELRKIISNIEVNIDYPEYQDIEEMTKEKIKESLKTIKKEVNRIIENSKNSRILTEGIKTAIIGRPNVGKSSILNKFSGYDKAIVTDIPGTTRDTVEEEVTFDGITLKLIDTAGIRKSEDVVEQIGVSKSISAIEESDLVIVVLNNNQKLTKEDKNLIELTIDKERIFVINKSDLESKINIKELNIDPKDIVYTNTKHEEGIDSLKEKIREKFKLGKIDYNEFNYVSKIEQIKRLEEVEESIESIEEGINKDMPIDILEIDIKNIWQILGELIGETYTEELLDNLFKDFCVGK